MRSLTNKWKLILICALTVFAILGCASLNKIIIFSKSKYSYQILIKLITKLPTLYESRELLLFSASEIEWHEPSRTLTIHGEENHSWKKDDLLKIFANYAKDKNGRIYITFYADLFYKIYRNGEIFNSISSVYKYNQ